MLLRRLTPAAELPLALTLEEAKAHLRLDHEEDDAHLTGVLIPAVAQVWTEYVKRPLMRADYLLLATGFRASLPLGAGEVVAVEKVVYLDPAGAEVEVESSRYTVSLYDPTALSFTFPSELPRTSGRPEAVQVYFSAGAADAAAVAPLRKQALLQLLAHFYENRQAVITGTIVTELPYSATWLMNLEREPTL